MNQENYYAAKTDKGKPRLDLIPPEWITGLGAVLTAGAEKYGAESWRTVPDAQSRYKAALMRHYTAAHAGQTISDDGLNPWLQVAINAMFLYSLDCQADNAKSSPKATCETCRYFGRQTAQNHVWPCNFCHACDQWKELPK